MCSTGSLCRWSGLSASGFIRIKWLTRTLGTRLALGGNLLWLINDKAASLWRIQAILGETWVFWLHLSVQGQELMLHPGTIMETPVGWSSIPTKCRNALQTGMGLPLWPQHELHTRNSRHSHIVSLLALFWCMRGSAAPFGLNKVGKKYSQQQGM